MATSPPPLAPEQTVQRVSKASSDELLRKFAAVEEEGSEPLPAMVWRAYSLPRKRSRRVASGLGARDLFDGGGDLRAAPAGKMISRKRRASGGGGAVAEWKALIPGSSRKSSSPAVRRRPEGLVGNGVLLAALKKQMWRTAVQEASKMFMERHSINHVRLMSDAA
ncbi:hypothetical protein AXF42_Ash014064 [Apostasia shenzhenica]|uniref:Uncharacterized protein n=1 Tax=Apostasia shenzhenica TaxID=1088818 RepID=A0A2I0A9B5_9ASPA|nr:hypothetical protein AXF42_Ash014064 [Apostasia shenzhenica]